MSRTLKILAVLIALASCAALAYMAARTWRAPLRIAVPPIGEGGQKLMQDLGREMGAESSWLSFQRLPVKNAVEASRAIDTGAADIALVRSDIALPAKGQTLVNFRNDRVFLLVPSDSTIDSFQKLKGRTIAVLPGLPEDEAVLDHVLRFYALAPDAVTRTQMAPALVGPAIAQRRITAAFVVGLPGAAPASDAFASIAKATKKPPEVIGIDEAEALAKQGGGFENTDIAQGSFGGATPQPEEAVTTLGVTWRLVASRSMSNMVAGEMARRILQAKTRMMATNPAASSIEAPDTEAPTYPIHPGARAYFGGEQPSMFDRFESLFWIGSALIGLLGSGVTWLVSRLRRPAEIEDRLRRVAHFITSVRKADEAELERLDDELDDVVARLVDEHRTGETPPDDVALYALAVDNARLAIARRRAALAGTSARVAPLP